jgi:hypothetical protein
MNSEQIISQPSKNYQTPYELLEDNRLEVSQIIKALENWKQECVHLQEGAAEGFGEEASNELQKVSKALIKAREMRDRD